MMGVQIWRGMQAMFDPPLSRYEAYKPGWSWRYYAAIDKLTAAGVHFP